MNEWKKIKVFEEESGKEFYVMLQIPVGTRSVITYIDEWAMEHLDCISGWTLL